MIFVWVILYGVIFIFSEQLSNLIKIDHIVTVFTLLIFTCCFVVYTLKTRQKAEEIKVFKFKNFEALKDIVLMLPLLCFPIFNLIFFKANFNIITLILMISVCMVEELFFRKYLLEAIMKKNKVLGFFLTALIFALFHAVNLINNCDLIFVFLQIISAFFVGLCYNGAVLRYQSILPTFILHLLTNICGLGWVEAYDKTYIIGLCFCMIIYFSYGVYFFTNQRKNV